VHGLNKISKQIGQFNNEESFNEDSSATGSLAADESSIADEDADDDADEESDDDADEDSDEDSDEDADEVSHPK